MSPELPKRGELPPPTCIIMFTITYSHIIGLFIINYSYRYVKCVISLIYLIMQSQHVINLHEKAKEFIHAKEERLKYFGNFHTQ